MVVGNVQSMTLTMDDDGSDDDNDAVVGYDDDTKRSGDDDYGHGKRDTTVIVLDWNRPEAAVQVPAEQRALLSRTALGFGLVSTPNFR